MEEIVPSLVCAGNDLKLPMQSLEEALKRASRMENKKRQMRNMRRGLGLSIGLADWAVGLAWPQAYRFAFLYSHFARWEKYIALYLLAASSAGFIASLLGVKRTPQLGHAGMALNILPFFVFGFLARGLDPTGFRVAENVGSSINTPYLCLT